MGVSMIFVWQGVSFAPRKVVGDSGKSSKMTKKTDPKNEDLGKLFGGKGTRKPKKVPGTKSKARKQAKKSETLQEDTDFLLSMKKGASKKQKDPPQKTPPFKKQEDAFPEKSTKMEEAPQQPAQKNAVEHVIETSLVPKQPVPQNETSLIQKKEHLPVDKQVSISVVQTPFEKEPSHIAPNRSMIVVYAVIGVILLGFLGLSLQGYRAALHKQNGLLAEQNKKLDYQNSLLEKQNRLLQSRGKKLSKEAFRKRVAKYLQALLEKDRKGALQTKQRGKVDKNSTTRKSRQAMP